SRIECRGRGPDECVAFSEIGIDEPNREVLVPDYLFSKVLVYDFDGNLKRILKTNYRINSIQVEDTLYFLRLEPKVFAGKDIRCVVAVNRDFEIVRDSISCITTPALDYIIGSHFTESNNGVYINEPYNDTLFSINTELQSIPVVSINRGKYSPPPEIIKNISNYISLSDKYVFSLYYFVDFPDCYFRIMFNQEYIIGKVSMLSGRSNIFYRANYISGGYTDDIEGGPDVLPRMSFRYGIQYSIIEPLHLFRNEYNSVIPGSDLSKLKEVVKRDDNPILRIFWPR
ncbi:MAG: 6-bladed beta-propeller, partial [Bacteroidetes bacterium]|nr:6-bladed beta-propeller [Bacteroidota bacterium]